MADPISLGILMGAGTLLSAYGSIQSGYANAASLQAQSNAQHYQAELQRQQGDQAMALSTAQAEQQNRQAKQVLGQERAALGENRIGFEGTGGMLIDQSAANAELDRQNILYQGNVAKQGLYAQSRLSDYAGDVASSQIGTSIMAGWLGAGSSLLSGAASYGYMNRGKF